MSTSETSFALSLAAFEQQALASLKETQDYAIRVAELAAEHPAVRAARGVPPATELIDSGIGVAVQALELQREFLGRLAETAAAPKAA